MSFVVQEQERPRRRVAECFSQPREAWTNDEVEVRVANGNVRYTPGRCRSNNTRLP